MSKNVFQAVGGAKVRRSAFDLSHRVVTAFYPGALVPLPPIEVLPGDSFSLSFNGVVRLTPLVTPAMQPMKLRYYAYFVPYRILDEDWEEFITGGDDGQSVLTLPVWDPALYTTPADVVAKGTLWDYFGMPTGVVPADEVCPIDYFRRAYLMIWNEFFRVPGLQDEVDIEDLTIPESFQLRWRGWLRGYYEAALPWTQRGLPPALPVFGSTSAVFGVNVTSGVNINDHDGAGGQPYWPLAAWGNNPVAGNVVVPSGSGAPNLTGVNASMNQFLDANTIDGSTLSSADINDFRTALQLQRFLELNARAGARYSEQLQSQFEINGKYLDMRLQRPEFIGGSVTDIIVSEVQQTSETAATPQGTLAGHGISLPRGFVGKYRASEHGVIIQIVCATPEAIYSQGIDRSWLRRTQLDFPFPLFAGIGEQEIYNGEIYMQSAVADPNGVISRTPFGYTGRYNELRYFPSKVTGEMRPGGLYEQWTGAREFSGLPPLDGDFVSMEAALPDLMRPFAVQNEPPLLAIFGLGINAVRPIPFMSDPVGLE